MKNAINTEKDQKPNRVSREKIKYAERRLSEVRLNFWVDGETSNEIEKLVSESGLNRQTWLARAIRKAISLELLDGQMTAGTIKGGFGKATPETEKPRKTRQKKATK